VIIICTILPGLQGSIYLASISGQHHGSVISQVSVPSGVRWVKSWDWDRNWDFQVSILTAKYLPLNFEIKLNCEGKPAKINPILIALVFRVR